MTHDEMIAVIQAHKDGKQIQRRFNGAGSFPWEDLKVGDYWNFTDWDYRIKPEEKKPRELVVVIDDCGKIQGCDWFSGPGTTIPVYSAEGMSKAVHFMRFREVLE